MMRNHRAASLGRLSTFAGFVAVALAMVLPAGAQALSNGTPSNGDPCPPYWTQVTPPTASFSFVPNTPATQASVDLDASTSNSGTAYKWTYLSADGMCESSGTAQTDPISLYEWNFGDGTTETDTGPTTSHTYASAGQYTVTLTVQEQNGRTVGSTTTYFTDTMSRSLTVSDRPPVASFTAPSSVSTGQVGNFDAAASADPDGTIANYHWDFGDGQTLDTAGPATAHIYSTAGTKTVKLTVTDNSGSTSTAQHTIDVLDRPPVASFTTPTTVTAGQPASLDASGSSDPDGTIVSYHWDFGDGQTQNTTTPTTSHTYSTSGAETVTLTVTDNSDSTSHAQHIVMVTAAAGGGSGSGTGGGSASGTGGGSASGTGGASGSGTGGASGSGTPSGGGHAHCVVPKLIGRTVRQTRSLLAHRHCRLGKVHYRHHVRKHRRGRVVAQAVGAGKSLRAGSRVAVTVGRR